MHYAAGEHSHLIQMTMGMVDRGADVSWLRYHMSMSMDMDMDMDMDM
jgi:hypothetical protein